MNQASQFKFSRIFGITFAVLALMGAGPCDPTTSQVVAPAQGPVSVASVTPGGSAGTTVQGGGQQQGTETPYLYPLNDECQDMYESAACSFKIAIYAGYGDHRKLVTSSSYTIALALLRK